MLPTFQVMNKTAWPFLHKKGLAYIDRPPRHSVGLSHAVHYLLFGLI